MIGDKKTRGTHVFDVGAGVDSDDVAVLDTEVVADNTVDAGLTIFKIVVGENNQDSVLALLSLDQNSIATEELESLHGVVGEGNDRVVIVGGVSDTGRDVSTMVAIQSDNGAYMSELGFFFFLRIAVDTSFSTWDASQLWCPIAVKTVVSMTYVLLLSARGVTTKTCQYAQDVRIGMCGYRTLRA